MIIKGILISTVAIMSDHIANGGEKLLGNASSIKQRPDGRVYISGQKQRHALFSAIDRLNDNEDTYVSNGDGISVTLEHDLRADLGGYLDTNKDRCLGRRTAPVTATPAVAKDPSNIGRDLLVRLKVNASESSEKNQALATREFSQDDSMIMNFFIDTGAVSIRKRFKYEKETHIHTEYVKHVTEEERKRRVRLTIEATSSLTDYANQARNAASGEPQQALIVFDTKLSRKAARYFKASDIEKKRIIEELLLRDAVYFIGDDFDGSSDSVATAYQKALKYLDENTLFDPTLGAEPISTAEFESSIK
jgi:CRISPR-associated protein Cst2